MQITKSEMKDVSGLGSEEVYQPVLEGTEDQGLWLPGMDPKEGRDSVQVLHLCSKFGGRGCHVHALWHDVDMLLTRLLQASRYQGRCRGHLGQRVWTRP